MFTIRVLATLCLGVPLFGCNGAKSGPTAAPGSGTTPAGAGQAATQSARAPEPGEGTFYVVSGMPDGKCLDARQDDDERLQMMPCNHSPRQRFHFTYDGDFIIRPIVFSPGAPRFVTVTGTMHQDYPTGAEVMSLPPGGGDRARWTLQPWGDGTYKFINKYRPAYCLDRRSNDDEENHHVQLMKCNNVAEQHWRLNRVE